MRSYGREVFPGTEISLADRWDLGDRDNFYPIWKQLTRLAGKLSVYTLQNLHHSGKLYPVSGKTFLYMNRTTLFDLSKCFLDNRDNFCPYEGGGQGGKRLPPPVPPLLPPVPFCELSPASHLFSTNLAMLLLLSRPI